MTETLVTTEELVKILGISSATVNYYTNLGLFKIKDNGTLHRIDYLEMIEPPKE